MPTPKPKVSIKRKPLVKIKKDKKGEERFTVVAANNKKIATSGEGLKNAKRAVEILKKTLPKAKIVRVKK